MNLNKEDDINKLMPLLPALTNFLEIRGSSDKHSELFNLACTSFQFILEAPSRFKDSHSNLEFFTNHVQQVNSYGLMEKWLSISDNCM